MNLPYWKSKNEAPRRSDLNSRKYYYFTNRPSFKSDLIKLFRQAVHKISSFG